MNPEKTIVYYLLNLSNAKDISFVYFNTSKIVGERKALWTDAQEEDIEIEDEITKTIMKQVVLLSKDIKVSQIYYNQSIVSFVTSLEVFLKDLFISSIEDNPELLKNINNEERKVQIRIKDLLGKDNKGKIVASCFNFQNLKSVRFAYELLFKVDLYKLISFEQKFSNKKFNSIKLLEELIIKRHNIMHSGKKYELSFEDIQNYEELLIKIGFKIFQGIIAPNFIKKEDKKDES